ncbi:MAG: carboxypeptidase regulatory-like domain-containing protein [Planctomycetes bacterium]|nr:carboxypeptidase regulatory-like domain-containing protein [Planctomycetota bacterium]
MIHLALKRLLFAAGLLLLAGCGDKASSSGTIPVTGLVTYQGKPVAEANVVFQSPERGSFAMTDAEGCFELQTFETGDGALPGEYKVMISKLHIVAPEFDMGDPRYVPPPPPKHLIPAKYADANSSGLTAKVEAGKANEFTFELTD